MPSSKKPAKKTASRAERRATAREERAEMTLRAVVDFDVPQGVRETLRDFSGEYDREVSVCVLQAMCEGMTMGDACLAVGVSRKHVVSWIVDDVDGMAARHRAALRQQAERWADEIVQIADDTGTAPGDVPQSKLRIDVRQWLMQRNSSRFGEKSTIVHEGNPSAPMQTITTDMTPEQAAAAWQRVRAPESQQ